VINFLSRVPTILTKTDLYLSALFDASSPIFVVGTQLTTQLIARCSTSLRSSESAIPHIRINGYSLAQTMPVSSAYYSFQEPLNRHFRERPLMNVSREWKLVRAVGQLIHGTPNQRNVS
jgi:hypothetical protein